MVWRGSSAFAEFWSPVFWSAFVENFFFAANNVLLMCVFFKCETFVQENSAKNEKMTLSFFDSICFGQCDNRFLPVYKDKLNP